jgi:integrase
MAPIDPLPQPLPGRDAGDTGIETHDAGAAESVRMSSALTPPAPAEIAPDLLRQLAGYVDQAKSPNTRRAYASDWRHFTGWCCERARGSLPAAPETVALYVTALAATAKVSTITRRLSAISQAHQLASHPAPTADLRVRTVVAGIRRAKTVAPTTKRPVLVDDLCTMLDGLPANLIGTRDRALLLIGFAGGFRRSELVALDWEDMEFGKEGLTVLVRRGKTDQEGQGRKIGIPYGRQAAHCPVRTLATWRDVAGGDRGPVFLPVDRHGNLGKMRLSDKAVARIVKRALPADRYDTRQYAGHSLRAGLATAAALGGASERAIMNQTGHRSVTMVRRYIRDGSLFQENAVAKTGL